MRITPKKEQDNKLAYVRLKSLEDLCRYAYNFDFTSENLICGKIGKGYRLMGLGETFKNTAMCYYIDVKEKVWLLKYVVGGGEIERAEIAERVVPPATGYITVVNMDISQFKETRGPDAKNLTYIRTDTPEDIIKLAFGKSTRTGYMPHVYVFDYKDQEVMCIFGNLHEGLEGKILYYTMMKDSNKHASIHSSFARYNYNEAKLEYTNVFGEHSYMYAKIINLAEPFSFFKP